MYRKILLGSTALVLASVCIASPALAKGDEPAKAATTADASTDPTGGDIVVTARKREEKLIDVPISIQAFGKDEIKAAAIDDIRDVSERAGFTLLSQVSTGAGGRSQGNLVFRGLQAVSFTQAVQSSGAAFVDGIYVSNAVQSLNTSDVERVEVLKGPQNAFFGRSTFGGAVNFVTRKPSDTWQGEVNLRQTYRGTFNGDASIEGPIVSGLLDARLIVYGNDKVADYRATDGGALGAESTYGMAATLYFTPASNLWFRIRGTYQRDDDSSADQAYLPARLYGGTSCTGRTFQGTDATGSPVSYSLNKPYFCNGLPSFDTLASINPHFIDASTVFPPGFYAALQNNLATNPVRFLNQTPKLTHTGLIRDVYRASAQGAYTFDSGGNIAFNVGYNESRGTYAFDIDHSSLAYFLNAYAAIDRDLTADVRLASNPEKRLRFLLGASYFWSRNASDRLDDNLVFGGSPARSTLFIDARNQTPAVYGSIDFDILPSLTVSADGRYEQEKDYNYDTNGILYEQKFNKFLPRGTIKFHPTRNLDIYGSYSEGVQPATLNTSFIIANAAQRAFIQSISPDQNIFSPQPSSTNYELGIKQSLFNNRVQYALAIYQIDWHKALQSSFVSNPPACNLTTPVGANGVPPSCPLGVNGTSLLLPNEARIRGIEFSGSARIAKDFDIALSVDYKDAKWISYYNSTYASSFTGTSVATGVKYFNGNTIGRVPNLTAVFTPSYHHDLDDKHSIYARADVIYTGKAWDSDLDIFQLPAFARVNLRIGAVLANDTTLEFFSTNLLNDKHFTNGAIVADVTELTFTQRGVLVDTPPPREFGIRFQHKFR